MAFEAVSAEMHASAGVLEQCSIHLFSKGKLESSGFRRTTLIPAFAGMTVNELWLVLGVRASQLRQSSRAP